MQLPLRALDLFRNAQLAGGASPARSPHPPVKPLARLVRLAFPEGGLVLDPFCGSGTTGAAAVMEDPRCLGFERDPAPPSTASPRARRIGWSSSSGLCVMSKDQVSRLCRGLDRQVRVLGSASSRTPGEIEKEVAQLRPA